MKRLMPLLLIGALTAAARAESQVPFIRQQQQTTGVVWDMPVVPAGEEPPALLVDGGGTLFQFWSIGQDGAKDRLLDQKLIGAYLPTAGLKVGTLDPYKPVARTRIDQPFTVEINLGGLLTGDGLPKSVTSVVLERHIAPFPHGETAVDPAAVISGIPYRSAYISTNGKTVLKFPASALTAADPTTASGVEHFVIHAVSDGSLTQTQLASGFVQVWPIASGAIKGISNHATLHDQIPDLELVLTDLYPRSDTYLMVFEGTQVNGVEGTPLKSFPMNRETCESHVLEVTDLDSQLPEDGTYTLALISDTLYGRELLCDPVTFSVERRPAASSMQASLSHEDHFYH